MNFFCVSSGFGSGSGSGKGAGAAGVSTTGSAAGVGLICFAQVIENQIFTTYVSASNIIQPVDFDDIGVGLVGQKLEACISGLQRAEILGDLAIRVLGKRIRPVAKQTLQKSRKLDNKNHG